MYICCMGKNIRILIIDNFDSFTYNLVHYLEPLVSEVVIVRTDMIKEAAIHLADALVISPGPGLPSDYPQLKRIIYNYSSLKPILGICLGQQSIAETFGGSLINLPQVWHGISRKTQVIEDDILFKGLPKSFLTGRYHSWVVDEKTLPKEFIITSRDVEGYVMSLSHKSLSLKSVQFHPESVLTPYGKEIMKNWVDYYF